MSFDIVYEENGDLIAEFDARADAARALAEIVEEKPHLIGRIGLLPVDAEGDPVGAFEPAASLLATA
jgi:hypothetical protein